MIIRTELLRMSILRILLSRSSLWKVKMLKVFKMLKETARQSMSSLPCASTTCPAGAGYAEESKLKCDR